MSAADNTGFGGLRVTELATRVQTGQVSAEEVARSTLAAIESTNEAYGAYLALDGAMLMQQARDLDARRSRGEALGPLAGVPIGVKDALCTRGLATTAASKVLLRADGRAWVPPYDATVVARLRQAGALVAGKCNMDELAMGSSNENSAFFTAKNPVDTRLTPGGSSGGSAVSVAARLTPASLGSDTGGSVRQPASHTGVVGVKPTYGRVSRYGLIAFASSLDQVGPMANDVRGAARVLGAIAGHDPHDSTSLSAPVGDYEGACDRDIKGLRIGLPTEYFLSGIDADVAASVHAAVAALERAGATVQPVTLPHTRFAVATYYVIATAEASSNLARFDGVRYGLRVPARGLDDLYATTRGQGFGAEVRRRILLGTYVLSAGYYEAYYLKAQRVRTLIRRDFDAAFEAVDVIAAPVAPTCAFPLGSLVDDPLTMYLSDIFTLPASLAGIPGLSVPAAPKPAAGGFPALPIGLQLLARPLGEEALFTVASTWEALHNAATAEHG